MLDVRGKLERFWDGQRLKFVWNKLQVLTLDGRARPVSLSWEGRQFRRGLDGSCKEIIRIPGPERVMHDSLPVSPSQGEELMRNWAARIGPSLGMDVEDWLERLRRDAQEFRSIYRPVSILPPDQYRSLVLQLTEGCAYNRCSFCNLYRDRAFHCKGAAEFVEHIGQVMSYFGAALPWRRGIFIGDANAAGLSTTRLAEALQQIQQCFPCDGKDMSGSPRHPFQFEQVSSFQDTFSGRLRTVQEWRELRQLGLRQVHLGVESGSLAVLKLLGKPVDPPRVTELVSRLQQADVNVSLIFLLGAGGKQLAPNHLQGTAELLKTMQLRPQDRVYLSELLIHPGSDYSALSRDLGLTPMTRWECREQAKLLREALNYDPPPHGPPVALYDVRQFVYT